LLGMPLPPCCRFHPAEIEVPRLRAARNNDTEGGKLLRPNDFNPQEPLEAQVHKLRTVMIRSVLLGRTAKLF
jgi:hypothetical protein